MATIFPGVRPEHPFGFFAYGQNVGGPRLDRNNRRFPQNNSPIPHVNNGISRPEVYPNVIGKQALKLRKHEFCLTNEEIKANYAGRSRLLKRLLNWCQRRDLNPRPKAYESSALPLSYSGGISGEQTRT